MEITLLALSATISSAQPSLYDSSFDIGPGSDGPVHSVLVQDDGRILIGGDFTTFAGGSNQYLVRLLDNGQPDLAFNLHLDGSVSGLLEQPDGRILVAGEFNHLGEVERHGIARLLTNGLVDPDFNANGVLTTNDHVWSMGLQPDGKILAGIYSHSHPGSKPVRLHANGDVDESWVETNLFDSRIFSFLARSDESILMGGTFQSVNGIARPGLALLDSTGHFDLAFDPRLAAYASIFAVARDDQGNILLGGRMVREVEPSPRLLARLKPDLQWDEAFRPDEFTQISNGEAIWSVFLQPDGRIMVGGSFYQVGGYWRRHLARLDALGRVDPCFDPGLGLGDAAGLSGAYSLAQQTDGRLVVGGNFIGFDGHPQVRNLVRVLPESDCNATRVHLDWYDRDTFLVLGTCTPGGTNLLQMSTNLVDWETLTSGTSPYLYADNHGWPALNAAVAFFRVKKVFAANSQLQSALTSRTAADTSPPRANPSARAR